MKKIVLLLIFSLFLTSQTSFSASSNYYSLGRQAYSAGNYSLAQKYFIAELNRTPNNSNARYYYAHTLAKQKKYNEAATEYKKIMKSSPNTQVAQYAKTSYDKITPYLTTEIKAPVPKNTAKVSTKNYIANAADESGKFIRWKTKPIYVLIPNCSYSTTIKSAFYTWQRATNGLIEFVFTKNIQKAQIEVKFTSKLNSADRKNYFTLGETFTYAYGHDLYKSDVVLLKNDPQTQEQMTNEILYAVALHEIGHALGIQGHSPVETDIMYSESKGQKTLSSRDISTVKELYTKSFNSPLLPDEQTISKVKLKEALNYTKKDPTNPVGWIDLGDVYLSMNDFDKALETYYKVLKMDDKNALALYKIGDCNYKMERKPFALSYYKLALNSKPGNIHYLTRVVDVNLELNDVYGAQHEVNRYLQRYPKMKNNADILKLQKAIKEKQL